MTREPLEIIELDVPVCSRVFGSAPCTAALSAATPRKCYNTRATCADPSNYAATTLTLRFARNQTGLPAGMTVFPAVQSVSSSPAEINLSGIDPATTSLGKRARKTVNLMDFTYHDGLTDPYRDQRISGAAQFSGVGYDPSRGTFWGKFMARWPYYVGIPLRHKRGYVGDSVAGMESSSYIVSEWSGPDTAGNVTITAKDILDLAENVKAVAPAPSNGKLVADITATATTATLTPTGIGAEYAASGRVCIGREVMTYTISGDVLTLTERGVDGTTAQTHAVNDQVQQCLRVSAARVSDTIADLLTTYAAIPAGYITTADWQDEEDTWMAGMAVTTTIAKPTGVKTLVGELCQLGVMVWWDDTAQKIRFRANRPLAPGESVTTLSDAANFLMGSIAVTQSDEQRISALFFWHGMIDPTGSATDPSNFAKTTIASVDDNLYGQDAFKTMYCRWFGQTGDDVAAGVIATRLVGRYQTTPRKLTAVLDSKDKANVKLGALVSAETYLIQDDTGATVPHQMQINRYDIAGDQVTIQAETYSISGRFGFIMQNPQPDYSTATANEIATGCFIVPALGTFADGTGPYVIY